MALKQRIFTPSEHIPKLTDQHWERRTHQSSWIIVGAWLMERLFLLALAMLLPGLVVLAPSQSPWNTPVHICWASEQQPLPHTVHYIQSCSQNVLTELNSCRNGVCLINIQKSIRAAPRAPLPFRHQGHYFSILHSLGTKLPFKLRIEHSSGRLNNSWFRSAFTLTKKYTQGAETLLLTYKPIFLGTPSLQGSFIYWTSMETSSALGHMITFKGRRWIGK